MALQGATIGHTATSKNRGLGNRQLEHYPDAAARRGHLLLVVAITISLYYALYVGGGVAPLLMREYQVPFGQFVFVLAIANLAGAFASLLAGLADRFGRANLVVWGLLLVGLLTLFGIPLATRPIEWAICTCLIGFVEGIVLVATPALMRDFSPQVGRATAMGFWTIGPVLGSLLVSLLAANTMGPHSGWRSQYEICGAVVLVVFLVSLFALRELRPEIRDQIMVNERDRKLVEWRARNGAVVVNDRTPFAQLMHPDVVASALGVSLLLLFYYTAVAFGIVVTVVMFGLSVERANSLANWAWGSNAVALIASGVLADRLRVRKPFMLVGAIGSLVTTIAFLMQFGGHPSYTTLAVIMALQAAFTGCAYATWMASYTETVEARNPALTATGLAIWGWLLRVIVTLSFLALPKVVTTVSAMVQAPIWIDAAQKAEAAGVAPAPVVISHLMALRQAAALAPSEWRGWYWICCVGIVVFLLTIFAMKGRWSTAAARRDEQAHDRLVADELARMNAAAE